MLRYFDWRNFDYYIAYLDGWVDAIADSPAKTSGQKIVMPKTGKISVAHLLDPAQACFCYIVAKY